MNHYLIFSAINDYFKDISSLDSGRIIAAFIYMDQFIAKVIAEEVILHTIPEYYDKYRGNPDPFDLQQVLDEAAKRGYSTTQGLQYVKRRYQLASQSKDGHSNLLHWVPEAGHSDLLKKRIWRYQLLMPMEFWICWKTSMMRTHTPCR